MKKLLLSLLLLSIASITGAKVLTLYYGPNHDGKYLELVLHGDEGIMWVRDSIPTYSHSRVKDWLKEPRIWRVKYDRVNQSDSTLVYYNSFDKPVRIYYVLSGDMSTLDVRNTKQGAKFPSERLQLKHYHLDHRAGDADFIGEPGLTIRISKSEGE